MEKIEKPWGYEEILIKDSLFITKRIFIKEGHRLSLQFHNKKNEVWLILRGRGKITKGFYTTYYGNGIGKVECIPAGIPHRIEAKEDTELIEVSTPELDDVVRLEDNYGRV